MKIKDFIKELQKCNPEAEIFTETDVGYFPVTGIIDYNGDNENFIIEREEFPTY